MPITGFVAYYSLRMRLSKIKKEKCPKKEIKLSTLVYSVVGIIMIFIGIMIAYH